MSRAGFVVLLLAAIAALVVATPARADEERATVPELVRTLMDGTDGERVEALRSLREIGPRAHAAVPAVLALLDSDSAPLRKLAALSLRDLGASAREVVPALTRLLDDEREGVREAAALSVSRYPGAPKLVAKALVKALFDKSAKVRKTTILMFAHAEVDPDITAPALLRALSTWKGESAIWAGRMLFLLGSIPESLRPRLERLLEARDPEVRYAALRCLQLLDPPAPEGLEPVVGALADGSPKVRVEAASALARWKRGEREAMRTLLEILGDARVDAGVRADALLVLGRLPDDEAGRRRKELVKGLASRVARLRGAAATGLRGVEVLPEAAVPTLLAAARDPDEEDEVRLASSWTLGVHGAHVDEVVPVLVELLDSAVMLVPSHAVGALAEIGPPARAAIPTLEKLRSGEDPVLRRQAIRALKRIGGEREE